MRVKDFLKIIPNTLLYTVMITILFFSLFHLHFSFIAYKYELSKELFLRIERKGFFIIMSLSFLFSLILNIFNYKKIKEFKNEVELTKNHPNTIKNIFFILLNVEFMRKKIFKLLRVFKKLPIYINVHNKIFLYITIEMSFVVLITYIFALVVVSFLPFLDYHIDYSFYKYLLYMFPNNGSNVNFFAVYVYYFLSIIISMVVHEFFHVLGALFPNSFNKDKYKFISSGVGLYGFIPVAYVILVDKKFKEVTNNTNMVYFGVVGNMVLAFISLILILSGYTSIFLSSLLWNNILLLASNLFPLTKGVDGDYLTRNLNRERYLFFTNDLTFLFLSFLNYIYLIYLINKGVQSTLIKFLLFSLFVFFSMWFVVFYLYFLLRNNKKQEPVKTVPLTIEEKEKLEEKLKWNYLQTLKDLQNIKYDKEKKELQIHIEKEGSYVKFFLPTILSSLLTSYLIISKEYSFSVIIFIAGTLFTLFLTRKETYLSLEEREVINFLKSKNKL